MAEIVSTNSAKQTGVKKSKKLSTRVDLTPMVDLGFLLITFFIFTTSMAEPKALEIYLPADKVINDGPIAEAKKTLQLVLKGGDTVMYFFGKDDHLAKPTTFAATGLRTIIQQRQQLLGAEKNELVVLINPSAESSYRNIVDALDEMTINGVTRYMLTDGTGKKPANL